MSVAFCIQFHNPVVEGTKNVKTWNVLSRKEWKAFYGNHDNYEVIMGLTVCLIGASYAEISLLHSMCTNDERVKYCTRFWYDSRVITRLMEATIYTFPAVYKSWIENLDVWNVDTHVLYAFLKWIWAITFSWEC